MTDDHDDDHDHDRMRQQQQHSLDELVPEQFSCAGVFGRESELTSLCAALDRVAARGTSAACRSGSTLNFHSVDSGGGSGGNDHNNTEFSHRHRGPSPTNLHTKKTTTFATTDDDDVGPLPGRSEVVLVTGPAGVGKSTLVRELARRRCCRRCCPDEGKASSPESALSGNDDARRTTKTTTRRRTRSGALFAAGKFDQFARREPYSPIVDAFSDLCRQYKSGNVAGDAAEEEDVRDVISPMDPESRALLGRIVPDWNAVFGGGSGGGGGGDAACEQEEEGGGGSTAAAARRVSLDHVHGSSVRRVSLDHGGCYKNADPVGDHDFKNAEALNRLQYALRLFVRSISGSSTEMEKKIHIKKKDEGKCVVSATSAPSRLPLVLFLDDLQWADETSVKIVESLVADPESRNVLFILSFRDDEVDEDKTPHLTRMLGAMENDTTTTDFDKTVTRIPVGPLDVDAIGELLSEALFLPDDRSKTLADIVHRKTMGNIFFATQFLISIHEQGLLAFSRRTLRWEWDAADIVACTDIADNVVDVVAGRIGRLPSAARELLCVASCLGASFHVDVLSATRVAYATTQQEQASASTGGGEGDVATILDTALREGMLEKVSWDEFKFSHDRVQQAAYSLIPEGRERSQLHYRIGKILYKMCSGSLSSSSPQADGEEKKEAAEHGGQEYIPYLAADQLNRAGFMVDDSERVTIAELDLAVAEDAMASGAFIFAADYLQSGLDLLNKSSSRDGGGSEKWSRHYDLTLRLCSAAAEAEHCRANFAQCEVLARDVLSNSRSMRDGLRAYFTLVECQCSDNRFDDALSTGFEALSRLGEPFPKKARIVFLARHFFKTSRMLKGKTNDDLLALPKMTDEDKIAAMRLMTTLWLAAVVSNAKGHLLLLTFRMVQLSLRYGLSDFSAVGFAVYGMITCGALGVDKGYRFGPLALELLESNKSKGSKECAPRVVLFAFCGVKHFRTPIHQCPGPFVSAYNVAMSTGDVEFGMLSALHYCMFYYFSGMALAPLEKDMRAYCKQMREYKQETSLSACLAYHQCVLNLMGMSGNTFLLTGECMDQEELRKKTMEAKNIQGVTVIMLLRMQLAYYFGKTDLAKILLSESQELTEAFKGTHWGVVQTFFNGLVAFSVARETKKGRSRRAYLKVGRMSLKKLNSLVKCGACNCLHMYLLLKAERLTFAKSSDAEEIREAYNAAITAASRVGFLQDKALSYELAGMYALTVGDSTRASNYLSQAHSCYMEWGAKAKADQLQRIHPSAICIDKGKRWHRRSVGIKSRQVFSSDAVDHHRRPSFHYLRRRSSGYSATSDSSLH